jgi:hypothetical protein
MARMFTRLIVILVELYCYNDLINVSILSILLSLVEVSS